jgi:hypothetical protein
MPWVFNYLHIFFCDIHHFDRDIEFFRYFCSLMPAAFGSAIAEYGQKIQGMHLYALLKHKPYGQHAV